MAVWTISAGTALVNAAASFASVEIVDWVQSRGLRGTVVFGFVLNNVYSCPASLLILLKNVWDCTPATPNPIWQAVSHAAYRSLVSHTNISGLVANPGSTVPRHALSDPGS